MFLRHRRPGQSPADLPPGRLRVRHRPHRIRHRRRLLRPGLPLAVGRHRPRVHRGAHARRGAVEAAGRAAGGVGASFALPSHVDRPRGGAVARRRLGRGLALQTLGLLLRHELGLPQFDRHALQEPALAQGGRRRGRAARRRLGQAANRARFGLCLLSNRRLPALCLAEPPRARAHGDLNEFQLRRRAKGPEPPLPRPPQGSRGW
mmetsp:Transcript_19776/g.66888  ORF Transcript_19776/g.66888 Transcript_19776/m.66888 type:complete len:205 (+) Transcript_19776:1090-1704(+)